MKTNLPNPLVPQGTFPDSQGKSRFQIAALTIGAIHLVVLGPLLFQGCKRTTEPVIAEATNPPSAYPPYVEPTPPPPAGSPAVTPEPSNAVAVTPPLPVVPEPPAISGTEHVVVKGDSFFTLGKKYNVSMKAIADANPGVDSKRLKIGQKLQIPAASAAPMAHAAGVGASEGGDKTHVVKSGDTLWALSRTYGVKESAIRSANNLKTSGLKVGQKLKIPAKAPVPVAAPTEAPAPGAPPPALP